MYEGFQNIVKIPNKVCSAIITIITYIFGGGSNKRSIKTVSDNQDQIQLGAFLANAIFSCCAIYVRLLSFANNAKSLQPQRT